MPVGRRPKPTALKVLAGNPGKRPLNDREPQPAPGAPDPPPHLSAEALAEWGRVCVELAAVGLLCRADRAALAAYCQVWARWVQAEEGLAGEGPVIQTRDGNAAQNPWLWVANKALDQLRHYAALFGLDPSSRSRIKVPPKQDEADPMSQFLQEG